MGAFGNDDLFQLTGHTEENLNAFGNWSERGMEYVLIAPVTFGNALVCFIILIAPEYGPVYF
jgi:hypothetical protein